MRMVKFALILLPCLLVTPSARNGIQDSVGDEIRLSTLEEIKSEFDSVPCNDKERLDGVKALFERLGADPSEIAIDKYKQVENLVIRKPGVSPEAENQKIVIGAHYDKVESGCGAVDNWTGIVAMAHIYRSLKNTKLNKTVLFIAFGKEERGLVGSAAMVDAIKKEQAAEYCAMINVDSLGLGPPQAADNISTKKLVDLSASIASEMKMKFAHAYLQGASSDSYSFMRKKIPALTIHALTNDWMKVLHTNNDNAAKVKAESVYLGYRLALTLLVRINASDCQAFRGK
jgi:Peptidase family M28